MRIVDELEESLTPDEQNEMALFLLENIQRINKHLDWHRSFDEPDRLAVDEFSHLRSRYIEQLAGLFHQYGMDVKSMPINPPDQRQVA